MHCRSCTLYSSLIFSGILGKGINDICILQVSYSETGTSVTQKLTVHVKSTFATICDLNSGRYYDIEVYSRGSAGYSAPATYQTSTEQSDPPVPPKPVLLNTTATTIGNCYLFWYRTSKCRVSVSMRRRDVASTLIRHHLAVGTYFQNDVVSASMSHYYVAPTLIRRHLVVVCPLRYFTKA